MGVRTISLRQLIVFYQIGIATGEEGINRDDQKNIEILLHNKKETLDGYCRNKRRWEVGCNAYIRICYLLKF